MVMAAKLTRLTHKIAIKLHLVAERLSCPCALTEHHAMKAYWGVEL
jgi:hypothetical protein